jgi:uncharacterized membrane protein
MDFINLVFPSIWQAGAFALLAPVLVWAALTAPWWRFDASQSAHVWYGTIFGVIVLWSIKASFPSALTFHLLGVPLFTLLAGPQLALIGTVLVVTIVTALRDGWWANCALDILASGAVPILVTTCALRAAERWLPPNFFVYIFVGAFFGPGVAMFVSGLLTSAAVVLAGAQPATVIVDQYLPYLLYLGFAEATISGMLATLLVVYWPAWVMTFDDARYLRGR